MANYTVQVANPRRKKAKKKASKRKSTKKRGKKKATKKRAKKKVTKKKATKRKTKKKVTKKKAKKKTAKRKTKKKVTKRKTAKKAAPRRKKAKKRAAPKKNPGQSWTLLSSSGVADKYGVAYTKGKWILRKGGRVLEGPMTATQMERHKSGKPVSTGTRLKRARALAAGTAGGGTARGALKSASAESKALVRLTKDIEETKTELGGEARALAEAVQRLTKARRKDKTHMADLEAQVKAAKARTTKARGRGDLTKKEEERLQDRLSRAQASLKRCRAELKDAAKAPSKRKATKKKASKKATKKRASRKAPARRRKPSWPSNVPRPGFKGVPERLTVEQAIHRLSVAGKNLRRDGASASGRRMQLASTGYLQLNPLEDIPGHPGMVAQFKSDKSTRARAVAAKTPRSVKPKGKKPVKQMSAREKQAILRRALRGV